MKKRTALVLVVIGFVAFVIALIGPYCPYIDAKKMRCKRYGATIETLRRTNKELLDGHIVLPKVAEGSTVELNGFVDAFGNKLIFTGGSRNGIYSKGDFEEPKHYIVLNSRNLPSDKDAAKDYYCGK